MQRLLLANITVPTGNAITNTSAQTSFADSALALNSNFDVSNNNGQLFTIKAYGYVSSKSASPGTLGLLLVWNNTSTTAVTLGTATFTMPASLSNAGFMLDACCVVCRTSNGTGSGRVSAQGMLIVDNAGTPISAGMVNTGTGTTGQIAAITTTNTSAFLALAAKFSLADPANSVTLTQLLVEAKA